MTTLFRILPGIRRSYPIVFSALLLIFLYPFLAEAFEVLIVKDSDIKPYQEAVQGFKDSCGCTTRELESAGDRVSERAVTAHADAVFAVGTRAFRKATVTDRLPVIYTMVMPSGLAALQTNNVSGVSMDVSPETCLSTIAELFPGVKRIGVLSDPGHTGPYVREAAAIARSRGLELVVQPISNPQQAPALLDAMRGRVDLLWMVPDATVVNADTVDYLMLFSFQNNLPIFTFSRKYVERGAVAALTIDPTGLGRQAGEIAHALSNGGAGPVRVYAKSPRLVINKKMAAKIGIRMNHEAIRNAEQVE